MWIYPDTWIYLLKGVPLTPDYNDTLYFNNQAEQQDYFMNAEMFKPKQFNKNTYQRVHKNSCRVEINAEEVYSYNYMVFNNRAFGNKWFYAFITNIEYINHNVTEVTYEIDIMQTWAFDYVLCDSYVVREHSETDDFGDHLLPEPIDCGEPYSYKVNKDERLSEMSIVITTTSDVVTAGDKGRYWQGTFTGPFTRTFPANKNGAEALEGLIQEIESVTGGANSIVSVALAPTFFTTVMSDENEIRYVDVVDLEPPVDFNGYVPNNNKIYSYPYSFLAVDCLNNVNQYRYEWFINRDVRFRVWGTCVGSPTMLIAPLNYMNSGEGKPNFSHQLLCGGYPQCSFNIDTYKEWLASQGVANYVSAGLGIAGSVAVGAIKTSAEMSSVPFLGLVGSAVGLANNVVNNVKMGMASDTARGSASSDINTQNKSKTFYYKYMGAEPQKIISIDNFFSKYGYACEKIKIPNRCVRKRWTYTKTLGCIVKGDVPANDLAKISKIFDNGITFWRNKEVGNYVMNDNGVL